MGKNKNKQTLSRREYIDDEGWKVLELTGPNFSTIFKTKDDQCIYINNGKIVHEGHYVPKLSIELDSIDSLDSILDQMIDSKVDRFVDGLFDNTVIDLEEVPKTSGTTYKYIHKEEKRNGCILPGCGGCLVGCCLLLLGTTAILWLLGEAAQTFVQFIINLF